MNLDMVLQAVQEGKLSEYSALKWLESKGIFGGFSEEGDYCGFDSKTTEWVESCAQGSHITVIRFQENVADFDNE